VKANQEAVGVDGQGIEEFEVRLADNLYKLWNRLSSGSYMPPPVRPVDIPKANGGTRPVGVPRSLIVSPKRLRADTSSPC
jgi:retron-type reverse transcriptase